MNTSTRILARLLAQLLEYPVGEPAGYSLKLRQARETLAKDEGIEADRLLALEGLEKSYSRLNSLELREIYSETFDLSPDCSLFMAWHKYGDTPKQGRALAGLSELYSDYGLIPNGSALPDYLPLMLEFLLTAPGMARRALVGGFGPDILRLGEKIEKLDNIYAALGKCLAELAARLMDEYGSGASDDGMPVRPEYPIGGPLWTT